MGNDNVGYKTITPLILKILNETITRYSIRKNNKPEPPKDWTRPIPSGYKI
ncbi:MAG: hypothetical protein IPJ13_18535 [Saprospiraceae bacterium]|nr:hypothetical protein [Saprospiraceae bacterium]